MFSKDEINTGRQFEIDVAKAFAVLFMILVHTIDMLTNKENTALYQVIEFFGCPPAAGVFMFTMGIGMVYTRHSRPREFAVRGVKLILMGIALNFFRETVLVLAGKLLQVENPWQNESILHTLLMIDILQFAGMAFLITALLKKLNMKPWMIALTGVLMNVIGTLFSGSCGNLPIVLQDVIGTCFFTAIKPAFPAFQWYIYPALGICFGQILRHLTDKDRFYQKLFMGSITAFLFLTAGLRAAGVSVLDFFMTSQYYAQAPLTLMWCMSVVLTCLPVYYLLSKRIRGKAETMFKFISSNVNTIYILQWLIITYTIAIMELLNTGRLPSVAAIPVGIVIMAACIGITFVWNKVRKGNAQAKSN